MQNPSFLSRRRVSALSSALTLSFCLALSVPTASFAEEDPCQEAAELHADWKRAVQAWTDTLNKIHGADTSHEQNIERGIDALEAIGGEASGLVEGVGNACRGTLSVKGAVGWGLSFTQAMVSAVMDVLPATNSALGIGVDLRNQWKRDLARQERAMNDALAAWKAARDACCDATSVPPPPEVEGEGSDSNSGGSSLDTETNSGSSVEVDPNPEVPVPPAPDGSGGHPDLGGVSGDCRVRPNGSPVSTRARNVDRSTQIDPDTTLVDCGDGVWRPLSEVRSQGSSRTTSARTAEAGMKASGVAQPPTQVPDWNKYQKWSISETKHAAEFLRNQVQECQNMGDMFRADGGGTISKDDRDFLSSCVGLVEVNELTLQRTVHRLRSKAKSPYELMKVRETNRLLLQTSNLRKTLRAETSPKK